MHTQLLFIHRGGLPVDLLANGGSLPNASENEVKAPIRLANVHTNVLDQKAQETCGSSDGVKSTGCDQNPAESYDRRIAREANKPIRMFGKAEQQLSHVTGWTHPKVHFVTVKPNWSC